MNQRQQLNQLEQALTRVYLRIYKEIKKEKAYPSDFVALKRKYNQLVYDNTRAAIQQAVILGSEKVNRMLKTQPYLTQKDIALIEKNSDEQTASFWRKVQLDIEQQQEQQLVGASISDFFNATAISSVFTSVADAIVSKVGQLADVFTHTPRVRWETAGDEKVCPICRPLDGQEWDYDDSSIPRPGGISPNETHYNCRCLIIPLE